MINKIIRFIKKSPFLYNLAKRLNRHLRLSVTIPKANTALTYYGYVLTDINRLADIKAEYEEIKKYNTRLYILVNNKDLNLSIHKLIRENPDISFSSFDYFKKYNAKIPMTKIIWIDYGSIQKELLDYLI